MKDVSGDSFDKMVARLRTVEVTENTTRITNLPDEFEPTIPDVDRMARMIP